MGRAVVPGLIWSAVTKFELPGASVLALLADVWQPVVATDVLDPSFTAQR
jgi:hypothetical protein